MFSVIIIFSINNNIVNQSFLHVFTITMLSTLFLKIVMKSHNFVIAIALCPQWSRAPCCDTKFAKFALG